MPYVSEKQRRFMYAKHPEIAKRWDREGHNYIKGKGGGFDFVGFLKSLVPKTTRTVKGASPGYKWEGDKFMREPTATPTPRKVPKVTPIPDSYEKQTMETFDKYEIPREVAFGIAQGEGGYRNKFNIGATDSNPTGAPIMDDLTSATLAAKLLSGKSKNSGKRYLPAFELRASPSAMLKKIQDLGYAGDPKTWKQRSIEQGKATGTRGAGEIYNSWADYIKSLTSWNKWHGKY